MSYSDISTKTNSCARAIENHRLVWEAAAAEQQKLIETLENNCRPIVLSLPTIFLSTKDLSEQRKAIPEKIAEISALSRSYLTKLRKLSPKLEDLRHGRFVVVEDTELQETMRQREIMIATFNKRLESVLQDVKAMLPESPEELKMSILTLHSRLEETVTTCNAMLAIATSLNCAKAKDKI
jgi:hypothetical protein